MKPHRLSRTLHAAEQAAIRRGTPTSFVVFFVPGKKGRRTADSRSLWRYMPDEAYVVEHLLDVYRVLR
jgi:hypothetical protein